MLYFHKMFRTRFRNRSKFLLAAGDRAAQVALIFRILSNIDSLFQDPQCKQNIIYYYSQWRPSFMFYEKKNIVKEWINKLPTSKEIEEKTMLYKNKGGSIIVMDIFDEEINKDTCEIFSKLFHDTNFAVFLLIPELFSRNRYFRDVLYNCTYLIANVKNSVDIISKGTINVNPSIFEQATEEAFSYWRKTLRIRSRKNAEIESAEKF